MTDDVFEHPRLAAIYDELDPDRSDLEVYAAIVDECGARRVLDVGCGTGTFALMVAARGLTLSVSTRRAPRSMSRARKPAQNGCGGSTETRPLCRRSRSTSRQ